ncbi:MATE family efflux transporter [Ammoniphilus sp. 3BR4]|uniref:MATE family efflux transporter n=1 Tax=Ammoniphilus sp. 3BR4 TaxID=3158265 RepID=UPI003465CBE4
MSQTRAEIAQIPLGQQPISHRQFIVLALPLILSTLSTPMLGAVDTGVVGHFPDPAYIGGVAVGAMIFNTLYWLLGFLRVSTSGFSAQAHGANHRTEVLMTLIRPMGLAMMFGVLFILLQSPIKQIAMWIIHPGQGVEAHAATYFDIRIWGAPFALINYCILGWLIGVSRVRMALFLQVFMNLLNIALDCLFVIILQMGVSGVAAASLISEITAVMIGMVILFRVGELKGSTWSWTKVFESEAFVKMIKVNRDLFIRTTCLLTVFGLFTAYGASMGEAALAANAILLQIHFIMAYFLDGIANASSILVGRSIGQKNKVLYSHTIKLSAIWSFIASMFLASIVIVAGDFIISLFTSIEEIQRVTANYLFWVTIFPFVGFWGLQLNGVFSGATEAGPIRNSLIISLLLFLLAIWMFIPQWGNHGLWLSFIVFSLARSLVLWAYLPKLSRTTIPSS